MPRFWGISKATSAANVVALAIKVRTADGVRLKTLFLKILATRHHFYRGSKED
jgi:hypothetical protein